MTQPEIGAKVGLHFAAISKIETGERETTTHVLFSWLEACNGQLLLRVDEEQPDPGWAKDLPPSDKQMLQALGERWNRLDEVQRELIRLQVRLLLKVSESDCNSSVKVGGV